MTKTVVGPDGIACATQPVSLRRAGSSCPSATAPRENTPFVFDADPLALNIDGESDLLDLRSRTCAPATRAGVCEDDSESCIPTWEVQFSLDIRRDTVNVRRNPRAGDAVEDASRTKPWPL